MPSLLEQIRPGLDAFSIELPSWGFANTGTRFGKYPQPAAAVTIEEKFADAAQVHALTGATPTLALHAQWDLPGGVEDCAAIQDLARRFGIRPGSINPNLFQDAEYKFGSLCHPDPAVRERARGHIEACIAIAERLGSRDISLWLADGSNYPGSQNIRQRLRWLEEGLDQLYRRLRPGQRLLIEYKPFEPAFYHTDIADWGMAAYLARHTGPQAQVLVDTGHHYQGQNIEQIVAWLLHLGRLGGFHFNDRRYADDDLTMGSIDPYQVFRIFCELVLDPAAAADVAFMVDQSHNLKGKMEAMVQTVMTAQELYAKALLLDREALAEFQAAARIVEAEECLRAAFWTDVRPALAEWRQARGLPGDPLQALRAGGYVERCVRERGGRGAAGGGYAG